MTNIYHIARYIYDNSTYVHFQGCNFHCKGCLLKKIIWDCHLSDDVRCHLQSIKNIRRLSLSEFETIIKKLNVDRAVLGGGEPTIDKELLDVIELLNRLHIETHILTNGYILNEELIEKLEKAGISKICVSIKAYDESIHRFYTGQTNRQVLENFMLLNESHIKLTAESVLIPRLIKLDEIERIAQFIASINQKIPFRIDGFTPIQGVPWRSASPKEVIKAVQTAKGYLKNVSCIHSETEQQGEVINVYPK